MASASATPEQSKAAILVVDDEPEILDLCNRLLGHDHEVVTTPSPEAGLRLVRERRFCAVIVDQTLPEIDGLEFMTRVAAHDREVGRVLITGHAAQDRVIAAINEGKVHAYILKPWKSDEFRRVVTHIVELSELRQRLHAEHDRYHRLVFDKAIALPTRHLVEAEVGAWLQRDGCLGVAAIDASELWNVQADYGPEVFTDVRAQFVAALQEMCRCQVRDADLLAVDEVESPIFCLFLSRPRKEAASCTRDVEGVARRLQDDLGNRVMRMRRPSTTWWPRIAVGHGFVLHNPNLAPTFQLRNALREARDNARHLLTSDDNISGRSQLERIIVEGHIRTVFQPIRVVANLDCLGYEALSRGPAGAQFEQPLFLLKVAERTGLSVELDRVFRTKALHFATRMPKEGKLFVNVLPQALDAPDLRPERLAAAMAGAGLETSRLVVELSEHYGVRNNATLVPLLRSYAELGIELAIDDVGAGYSGLERIEQLRPHYLKVDISLITAIQTNPVKRALLTALLQLAHDMNAKVIAEGVETEDELQCLRVLGVELAQGYLLGRPAPPAEA
ncbi:MAG: EAL domain-containing protein [Deltaproteobacteria bacterium]|nr:EAL domain-containing protein [Deltaproteobacteria bacterium]